MKIFFSNINFSEDYSEGCIGVNIYPDNPGPEKFYLILKELISSKKATEIFVRISDIDEPEEWFFSDTIYITTKLSLDELRESLEALKPDEIYEDWMYGKPANIGEIESGSKIYSVFWD